MRGQAPVWNTVSPRFSTNHKFRKLYGDGPASRVGAAALGASQGKGSEGGTAFPKKTINKKMFFRTMHVNSCQHGWRYAYSPFFEHDHAFEDVNVLIEAFEETLHALNLVDRLDWLTLAAINAE
jgi:hypothetical protein